MASRRQQSGQYLGSAVREALDSVVAPSVRDAVLARALAEGSQAEVPDDPLEFESFLAGPLRRALLGSLGHDAGQVVFAELERVSQSAISSVLPPAGPVPAARRPSSPKRRPSDGHRRSAPAEPPNAVERPSSSASPPAARRPTPLHVPRMDALPVVPDHLPDDLDSRVRSSKPSPPSSNDYPAGTAEAFALRGLVRAETGAAPRYLPQILVVSAEPRLARRLACWVDEHVAVMRIPNLMGLLYAIEDAGPARTVIVVDCLSPSIRPHSIATLAEEVPALAHVVLWGAASELSHELARLSPRAALWRSCAGEARDRDVAQYCVRMIR